MKGKVNVLFVCLGNICRSPMAEAIFKMKMKERNLDAEVHSDSCGTADYHIGKSPDPRTIEIVRQNNTSMNHFARQLIPDDFMEFDHILVMDHRNLQNAKSIVPRDSKASVKLMRDYDQNPEDGQVPDPYWDDDGFQHVFDILDRSIEGFIEKEFLRNKLKGMTP